MPWEPTEHHYGMAAGADRPAVHGAVAAAPGPEGEARPVVAPGGRAPDAAVRPAGRPVVAHLPARQEPHRAAVPGTVRFAVSGRSACAQWMRRWQGRHSTAGVQHKQLMQRRTRHTSIGRASTMNSITQGTGRTELQLDVAGGFSSRRPRRAPAPSGGPTRPGGHPRHRCLRGNCSSSCSSRARQRGLVRTRRTPTTRPATGRTRTAASATSRRRCGPGSRPSGRPK